LTFNAVGDVAENTCGHCGEVVSSDAALTHIRCAALVAVGAVAGNAGALMDGETSITKGASIIGAAGGAAGDVTEYALIAYTVEARLAEETK
jgi:hypothetical protein